MLIICTTYIIGAQVILDQPTLDYIKSEYEPETSTQNSLRKTEPTNLETSRDNRQVKAEFLSLGTKGSIH